MRIVCDNCAAKYQIADEKIAGKLFRVRCKKCSHMIMVDGTKVGGAVAEAAGVGGEGAGEAVWYVVIDGAQTGPLMISELQAQLDAGTIDASSYSWREGMADWQRLADVPALANALTGLAGEEDEGGFDEEATQVVDPSTGAAPSATPSAPAAAPAPAAPAGSGLLAAASSSSQFFATKAPEPEAPARVAAEPAAPSSGPSADASGDGGQGMTGERNESSVLFSLNDLASSKSKTARGDDLPRTEGSGLIDIRTLASANAALAPPTEKDAGAAKPAAIGAVAPATMAPMALPPRKSNTGLYALLGAVIVLLLLLGGALIFVLSQDDPPPPVAVAPVPTEQPAAAPEPEPEPEPTEVAVAEPEPEAAPVAAAGSGEGSGGPADGTGEAAPTEVAAVEPTEEAEPAATARNTRPAARPAAAPTPTPEPAQRPSRPAPSPEPEAAPTPTPPRTAPREERSSDAVAAALAAIQRDEPQQPAATPEPTPAPTPEPEVRTRLSRDDVTSTIRRYNSRVMRCSEHGESGTYWVDFVIQPSGNVTNVSPEAADDVSQCVAGVVRDMTFPRWTGDPEPVRFPFRLR